MSIETRIQAINDHLIDDYSVLRLAGADLSGVNKNIVNLKMSWKERLLYFMNNGTQEVWDNWEKVNGTGTTLSLNNTEEAPMSLTYKGNTSQTGTPTPSSPIPVQVVSGDNTINVVGKNLIPITYAKIKSSNTSGSWNNNVYSYNSLTFTVNEDLSVVINGTASANTAFNLIGTTNLFVDINISNGNYVLSGSTGGKQDMSTWGIYMAVKHSDNTTETQFCYNGDLAFTKVEGDTFFPVIRIGSGTICNNIEIKPMIRKSGTNSTYQPYIISSYPISLSSSNMFDKTQCAYGYRLDTTGKNFLDISYFVSPFIEVKPNTQYTKNSPTADALHRTAFYTSNNENSVISVDSSNNTFTTPANCKYLRFCGLINEVFTTQLNKGNVVLPYQEYFTPIELCKIGTYQDKIFKNTPNTTDYDSNLEDNVWYLKKEIGKVVLNGSETWSFQSQYPRIVANYTNLNINPVTYQTQALSNYFVPVNTENSVGFGFGGSTLALRIDNSFTTLADHTNWLSTHNTDIYYILKTPTYETITDTTLIRQLEEAKKSYESQTNISQTNNDLPFELSVTALEVMS